MAKKTKRIRLKAKKVKPVLQVKLQDMNQAELHLELSTLPRRIVAASDARDALFGRLRERWSNAYANDTKFIEAYVKAEAAGQEVISLQIRLVKAAQIFQERYGKTLL